MKIPIEVSARHVHLSPNDLETLFGKGYELKKRKGLFQDADFLSEERLSVQVGSRTIPNVSIIGPVRKETQVELSHTDAIFLGVEPIVRDSGDIKKTPGALLVGSQGKVELKEGVINTWRHIHCNPQEAEKLGLKDGDLVSVQTEGDCSITFHNVRIKVDSRYQLCMHLDTDEGNAACMPKSGEGIIIQ